VLACEAGGPGSIPCQRNVCLWSGCSSRRWSSSLHTSLFLNSRRPNCLPLSCAKVRPAGGVRQQHLVSGKLHELKRLLVPALLQHLRHQDAQRQHVPGDKQPYCSLLCSVADSGPNPDPRVFGSSGSGSGLISQRYG
jgi:hypothetical protein